MEPEKKKVRLNSKSTEEVDKYQLECILPDYIFCDLTTVEVYVGKILDKQLIRKVIIDLNHLHPIPSLQHLKRVNDGSVLICLCNDIENVEEFLIEIGFEVALLSDYKKLSVISKIPMTRKQFEVANKIWPCNFHEDKYLEKLISNNLFTDMEMMKHEHWMELAIDIALKSIEKVGTVIINPSNNELICAVSSEKFKHPLKHSVMLAIDTVARIQGGGNWTVCMDTFNMNNTKFTVLGVNPYLCTGYYVYTTHEPCIMCAMALIHSRINRLFYGITTKNGALGSIAKLHTIKSLNHHYEVFKGLLSYKCKNL